MKLFFSLLALSFSSFLWGIHYKNLAETASALNLENILMQAAKEGKDLQEVHEKLREDPSYAKSTETKIEIGRSKEQTENFLKETISPFLAQYKDLALPPSEAEV